MVIIRKLNGKVVTYEDLIGLDYSNDIIDAIMRNVSHRISEKSTSETDQHTMLK